MNARTTGRRPATLSFEQVYETLTPFIGKPVTVRLVALDGTVTHRGTVSRWPHRADVLTIAGDVLGGEIASTARVEVKGKNGRYALVVAAPLAPRAEEGATPPCPS